MKIVIDISDELYRILKRNEADIRRSHDALKLAVIDGPVYPVRPQGEWKHNSDHPDNLICSVCNCEWDMWRYESKELKFCPNCGADMRGGGE